MSLPWQRFLRELQKPSLCSQLLASNQSTEAKRQQGKWKQSSVIYGVLWRCQKGQKHNKNNYLQGHLGYNSLLTIFHPDLSKGNKLLRGDTSSSWKAGLHVFSWDNITEQDLILCRQAKSTFSAVLPVVIGRLNRITWRQPQMMELSEIALC